MTKLSYSGLKYGENNVEIKLLVDIQFTITSSFGLLQRGDSDQQGHVRR